MPRYSLEISLTTEAATEEEAQNKILTALEPLTSVVDVDNISEIEEKTEEEEE